MCFVSHFIGTQRRGDTENDTVEKNLCDSASLRTNKVEEDKA